MATMVENPTAIKTKGRILIVDDELVVRDSLGKWFTSEGYTARPVASGREALEILQQVEFDIALIDIKMPGMDGMELQSRLHDASPGRQCLRQAINASTRHAHAGGCRLRPPLEAPARAATLARGLAACLHSGSPCRASSGGSITFGL